MDQMKCDLIAQVGLVHCNVALVVCACVWLTMVMESFARQPQDRLVLVNLGRMERAPFEVFETFRWSHNLEKRRRQTGAIVVFGFWTLQHAQTPTSVATQLHVKQTLQQQR